MSELEKNVGTSGNIDILTADDTGTISVDSNVDNVIYGPSDKNKGLYLNIPGTYGSSDSIVFGNVQFSLYTDKLCFEGYSAYTGELKTIWEYSLLWTTVVSENYNIIMYQKIVDENTNFTDGELYLSIIDISSLNGSSSIIENGLLL